MQATNNLNAPREWNRAAIASLLFVWLAITICSYYILRPVRSALILTHFGPQALPWVYMGAALFTGLTVWVYSHFVHLPRRRLLAGVLLVFLSNFPVLWWLARTGSSWLSPILYVWTDVFSIMSVTIFWIYANDLFDADDAKQSFGRIGAAGMVGAMFGAWLTQQLVGRIGVEGMMLVAGGVYSLILPCFATLEWITGGRSASRTKIIESFEKHSFESLVSIARSILASRTLTLLVVVVAFERFAPDFVDYIFSSAMYHAFPEKAAFAHAFAFFDLWRNGVIFVTSFFLTSRILKNFGVHRAMTAVPLTILIGCATYSASPVLAVAIGLKGLEEGQRHAWYKAGKETVYTATNTEVIYKVKAYIEMFVYRFARGAAGLMLLILTETLGLGPRGVALAALPLAAAWGWATWLLGSTYEAIDSRPEPSVELASVKPETVA